MKLRKDSYSDVKKLLYPNFEGQHNYNYQNVTPVRIYYTISPGIYLDYEKVKVAYFDNMTWTINLI